MDLFDSLFDESNNGQIEIASRHSLSMILTELWSCAMCPSACLSFMELPSFLDIHTYTSMVDSMASAHQVSINVFIQKAKKTNDTFHALDKKRFVVVVLCFLFLVFFFYFKSPSHERQMHSRSSSIVTNEMNHIEHSQVYHDDNSLRFDICLAHETSN
jgi:hypothetical protein